jgi:hypothetical protein
MNQSGPPPKKQELNIRDIIIYIKNTELKTTDEKIKYLKKYKYIQTDYTFLYNIIINNNLDDNSIKEVKILNIMLSQINNINDNKISKQKCEESIGKVLVDEYVNPLLDKKK